MSRVKRGVTAHATQESLQAAKAITAAARNTSASPAGGGEGQLIRFRDRSGASAPSRALIQRLNAAVRPFGLNY